MYRLSLCGERGLLSSYIAHRSHCGGIFFFKDFVLLPLSPDFCQSVKETIRATPSHWANTLKPTRLPCPWDSPGKNTGVGCHFLLQCMNVKSESEVAQSFDSCDPMDCGPPGSSVLVMSQARILEWVAISFSGDLPDPGIEPMSLVSPALADRKSVV